MIGEAFALLSACSFALGGACIAKGSQGASGDNGAFLSIILTALLAGGLWLLIGASYDEGLATPGLWQGIVLFVLTGVLATIFGRATLFKSVVLAGAIKAAMLRRLTPLFAALFAFVVLGETIGMLEAAGIAVIVVSLVAVRSGQAASVQRSSMADEAVARSPAPDVSQGGRFHKGNSAELGQLYGIASATSYGASYVTRKQGMQYLSDPTLGTLVAAITGLAWYLCMAPFSASYRSAIVNLVRNTGRWQFTAAAAISAGQTFHFFALQNTEVATVAIIGSLDVFISFYFAAYLLRTEPPPSRRMVLASIVATAGVVMVALG